MSDRKQLEVVREPELADRVAELERALAALLRTEAPPAPAGTVVIVSTEDLALAAAILFALVALVLAARLARLA